MASNKLMNESAGVETVWHNSGDVVLPCNAGDVGPDGKIHEYTAAAYLDGMAKEHDVPGFVGAVQAAVTVLMARIAEKRGVLPFADAEADARLVEAFVLDAAEQVASGELAADPGTLRIVDIRTEPVR